METGASPLYIKKHNEDIHFELFRKMITYKLLLSVTGNDKAQ